MVETRVYPAGQPLEGKWVLSWRTSIMKVPAYWYYDNEGKALDARKSNAVTPCACCKKAETEG